MNTSILGKHYGLISSVVFAFLLAFAFSISFTHAQEEVDSTGSPQVTADSPIVIEDVSTTSTIEESVSIEEAVVEEVTVPEETVVEETASDPVVEEPAPTEETVVEEAVPAPAEETTPTEESAPDTSGVTIEEVAVTSTLVPELTTDKADYHPGETANIFGKFFGALQSIVLTIFGGTVEEGDYTESTENITTDEEGSFATAYLLEEVYRPLYTVFANDMFGNKLAEMTFTDSHVPAAKLSQFANIDGNYQGGSLNGTNSEYEEGESVPYRYLGANAVEDGGPLLMFIKYQYVSTGGENAFDYLTSDNATEPQTDPIRFGDDSATKPSGFGLTTCPNEYLVSIPDDLDISLDDASAGQLRFCSSDPLLSVPVATFEGIDGNDKVIKIVFEPGNNGSNPTNQTNQDFALFFGGHLAIDDEWLGDNNGSGDISGAPFHMRIEGFTDDNNDGDQDGGEHSLSAEDRSIQGAVVALSQATLTVIKHVVNDNGGTATADGWTMDVTATNPSDASFPGAEDPGTTITIDAGDYSVAESGGPSGYTQTSAVGCSGTLAAGASATCTITNDDNAPSLTLVKEVTNNNGGTAVPGDWTLTATGYDAQSPDAGTYNLSESAGPAGYIQTSLTCDNAVGEVTSVTLGLGEDVTCTFVNDDDAPSLTLVKEVVGGGNAADWTLTASGPTGFSGAGPSVSNGASFDAGTYDLSESGPTGYDASAWVCVGGTQNDGDTVTLGLSQSATCTITNTQRGHIVIVKDVIGNPDPTDFTFQNNFGNGNPASFQLDEDTNATLPSSRSFEVLPGTYSVSEDSVADWQLESATCDQDETIGSIDVAPGETVTCTFVNEELVEITLVKNTVGSNGTFDFTMTGTGLPATDQLTTVGNTQSETYTGLDQDDTFSIAETVPAGWDLTSATCSGGETPENISPEPGEHVTCTFVNSEIPTLTLEKTVVNDNGGTATEADFQGKIDGGNVAWDSAQALATGAHTASEATTLTGYSASAWGGNCEADGSITLAYGDHKTCTITNDDIQPKLTVTKTVTNDDGGNALVSDFPLFVNATGVTSGVQNGFNAGSYTVSETNQAGYTAGDWGGDCATNGSITLSPGDVKSCTITNDDIAPTLKLVKQVTIDNGGAATAGDWDLTATGGADGFTDAGDSVIFHTVTAGVDYALSELGPDGYTASSWSCTDGDNDGTVTLDLDEDVTCTITNDDIAPVLTLVKVVTNNNGGTALTTAWTLLADGPTDISGAGGATSDSTFSAGSYALSESGPGGYAASLWNCVGGLLSGASLSIGVGQTATCTITNDDVAPILHLRKVVVNDNGGTAVATDWTLTADGTKANNDLSGASPVDSGATLQTDTWTLSESGPSGYLASPWVCVGGSQNGNAITLGLGEEATCTITNDDTPGHFTGGGSIFPTVNAGAILSGIGKNPKDTRVTHGFTLHCDIARLPNRLEVNWGPAKNAQKFHLTTLTSAVCSDNPNIDPQQPNADIDTIVGTGVGRFQAGKNKEVDATISFTFNDDGEPGKDDQASMIITTTSGEVLNTGGLLKLNVGNQQAHQDN